MYSTVEVGIVVTVKLTKLNTTPYRNAFGKEVRSMRNLKLKKKKGYWPSKVDRSILLHCIAS